MAYESTERTQWTYTGGVIGFLASVVLASKLKVTVYDYGWIYLVVGYIAGGFAGYLAATLRRKLGLRGWGINRSEFSEALVFKVKTKQIDR